MSIRRFLTLGLSLLLIGTAMTPRALTVRIAPSPPSNADRAVASYQALQRYFYRADLALYRDAYPGESDRPFAEVWPFSQAMAATIDMSALPWIGFQYESAVRDRLTGLDRYWNGSTSPPGYDSGVVPPAGVGGDKFYDDALWIGLELVQVYRMTGNDAALRRAREVFDFTVLGWDTDPSHPAPGGIFWTQAEWCRDRNTVSTAPAAELGLHLYEITGDPYYLRWAIRMYDWVNQYLAAPNGLYWDHIALDGTIETTQWSYNQGTMVGASVLLFRATGDPAYLDRARRIAATALAHYGQDARYHQQHPAFNAIFFKNLLLLEAQSGERRYRHAMQTYADEVWESNRDPETGLFVFRPGQPVSLLEQAAMVQIYAALAWEIQDYAYLAVVAGGLNVAELGGSAVLTI